MSALRGLCVLLGLTALSLGQDLINVDTLHVTSEIRHRYAVTLVTSQVTNMADFAQDVRFDVQLPKEAFISNFSMLIDGVVYPGDVEEKEAAAERFEQAVQKGQSAGLVVTKSVRETNDFTVSVNVAASNSVTFNLTYQELLQRRTGLYEHVIYVNPGVIVPDLRIEVFINESREITELTVPEIRGDRLDAVITGSNKFALIEGISSSAARVTFAPTPEQQQEYTDRGVSGQFIVNYDVDHDVSPEGEILVSDGYFVHFFAPDSLPAVGKRIIFVLDVSGSMSGTKIRQLREALVFILDELRPIDEFGILTFNNVVNFWPDPFEMLPASSGNVDRAKMYAETINANGGTNIHDALVTGLQVLSSHPTKPSMVLFLTDGQATSGETNPARILESVSEARQRRQFIYSLAFGSGADFDLIRKISAQNKGFARRIYEDADATLQLAGFYRVIFTPLLSEVFISYLNESVDLDNVTNTEYPGFFRGSEIVICGPFVPGSDVSGSMRVLVEGIQNSSNLFLMRSVPTQTAPGPIQGRNDFIERLWVYLTIKQLIETTLEEDDPTSPITVSAKARIIELALKYSFVTPYTSMVVTKPSEKQTIASPETEVNSLDERAGVRGGLAPRSNLPGFITTTPRLLGTFAFPPTTTQPRTTLPFTRTTRPPGTRTTPRRTFPTTTTPPPTTPFRTFPTTTFLRTTIRPGTTPPFTRTTRPPGTRTTIPRGFTTTTTTTTTTPRPAPTTADPRAVLDFASGLNVQLNETSAFSLCLDVPARSTPGASEILLLRDMRNGIVLTADLHDTDYDNYRKFSEVHVTLSAPNQDVNIWINAKSISIGPKTYRWWQVRAINSQGIFITDKDGIQVSTAGGLVLTFNKFGLETTRSLTAPYITVTAENLQTISDDATGALGPISKLKDVRQTNPNTLTYILPYGGNGMEMSSANRTEAQQRRREARILEDNTVEEERCVRLYEPDDLEEILNLRTT